MEVALIAFLRPFFALLVLAFIVYPISVFLARFIPDGRIKHALYMEREGKNRPRLWWIALFLMFAIAIASDIRSGVLLAT